MFQYVHHVHYIVEDRDATVEFLEKTFGMKPTHVNDIHDEKKGDEKEALYEVGQTQIQIVQPMDPSTLQGKFLATHGPGLFHVGWGIDDLPKLAREVVAKGGKIVQLGQPVPDTLVFQSSHGYMNFAIDPATTHGVYCHLCGPRTSK